MTSVLAAVAVTFAVTVVAGELVRRWLWPRRERNVLEGDATFAALRTAGPASPYLAAGLTEENARRAIGHLRALCTLDYGHAIGRTANGKPITKMTVVVERGKIITAYPVKPVP